MECPLQLFVERPQWALVGVETPVRLELKNFCDSELVDFFVTIEEGNKGGGINRMELPIKSLKPGEVREEHFTYIPTMESGCGPRIVISAKQHPIYSFSTAVRFGAPVVEYSQNMSIQINAPFRNEGVIAPVTAEGDNKIGNTINLEYKSRESAILGMLASMEQCCAIFEPVDWKPSSFHLPLDFRSVLRMRAVKNNYKYFSYGPKSARQVAEFSDGGYWMSSHPVTRAEFRAVMESEAEEILSRVPSGPDYDAHREDRVPVTYLKWREAREYCTRLTRLAYEKNFLPAGFEFRLPTEAEWEYACTLGNERDFYDKRPETIAWAMPLSGRRIAPVSALDSSEEGYRKPNEIGIYDLHGLVYEWCMDEYMPIPDPSGRIDPWVRWQNECSGYRVCRGGAYFCGLEKATSHSRAPMKIDGKKEYRGFIGFRVVLGACLEVV